MGSNDTTQDAEPRPKFLGMLWVSSRDLLRLIIIAASHDGFSRALPPQCRQGIGRVHAGPDIIYEGEILDLLVQRRRDKARVVKLMRKTHRPGRGLWTN